MALYEYFCPTCRMEFELMRPMSEAERPARCPDCSSEALKLISSFGSKTGDSMQSPKEPFRRGLDTRMPRRRAKVVKRTKRRGKPRRASSAGHKTDSLLSPPEKPLGEDVDFQRSTGNREVQTTAVLVEDTGDERGVNSPQAAIPIEMSWITDYQPNGGNLWFIQDWGIASMLGYLRDNAETEPIERPRYPEEAVGIKPVDYELPAREQQTVTAVRPWPEEIAIEPAEAVVNYPDISDQRAEVPVEATPEPATASHSDARTPDHQADVPDAHSYAAQGEMDLDFPDQVIEAAWRRQGGRCAKCGRWLIRSRKGKDGGTGAWQPHLRNQGDLAGNKALADCVIFCSGGANCHFNIGHGGIGWSHYAPLEDSELLFLVDRPGAKTGPTASTVPRRSLLKEVLGIHQPRES